MHWKHDTKLLLPGQEVKNSRKAHYNVSTKWFGCDSVVSRTPVRDGTRGGVALFVKCAP